MGEARTPFVWCAPANRPGNIVARSMASHSVRNPPSRQRFAPRTLRFIPDPSSPFIPHRSSRLAARSRSFQQHRIVKEQNPPALVARAGRRFRPPRPVTTRAARRKPCDSGTVFWSVRIFPALHKFLIYVPIYTYSDACRRKSLCTYEGRVALLSWAS